MELIEGIRERRSVRKFTDEKIPREVLREVVAISRFAPSWKNGQIARYHIVEGKELKKTIAKECVNGFTHNTEIIEGASALAVISYVTKRSGFEKDGSYTTVKGDRWEMFDVGIAAQTFCLTAHAKGIGTCILGIFDEEKIAGLIRLPKEEKIGVLVAMGYFEGKISPPGRKEAESLIDFVEE